MPLNPFAWIFAVIGTLSAASIVLGIAILWRLVSRSRGTPSLALLIAIVVLELPLFFMGGGYTIFDPYSLGYRGAVLPVVMALLVAIGWLFRAPEIFAWVGLASLLYVFKAYGSLNIWDYLLDAVACAVAILWLIGAGLCRYVAARAEAKA